MKILETSQKIAEIQSRLAKYTFLSRHNLPGYLDGVIFEILIKQQKYPDRKSHPNFYHWYILMRQFASSTISKWIQDKLYYDPNDILIQNFIKLFTKSSDRKVVQISTDSPSQQYENKLMSPKFEMGVGMEYVIDILLKDYTDKIVQEIVKIVELYQVQITPFRQSRLVKIKCKSQYGQHQEMVDLISKNIEYENIQVKRQKKLRPSFVQLKDGQNNGK